MTAPQTEATTDPQSIIAALQQRLDAALSEKAALTEALATRTAELAERTAELAGRKSEFDERIEHQAATVDVLKVMSATPGDTQPVFDLIVRRSMELCSAPVGSLFEYDGELVHARSHHDIGRATMPGSLEAARRQYPMPPTRGSIACRAILDRQIVHVPDVQAEPDLLESTRAVGHRSQVSVPLMRGETAIGVISLGAREPGGFRDSQIELLRTFAEQAVIAISSAETYRALQTRTSDLQETLEYQTATSDVLKVISQSTFDLQPVLDTVVETAARLCDADQAVIARREGDDVWRLAANFGFPPEFEAYHRSRGAFSYGPGNLSVGARAARERRPVHIHDAAAVPGYPELSTRLGKQRTSLGVPLLREGEAIGIIALARQRVEPFTDRQIELVRTFADQAVIAIENTRLITEQREALEQQTATAEVLAVINSSPGDLGPVFDVILEKAHTLCGATLGSLVSYDGEFFHRLAMHGYTPEYEALIRSPSKGLPYIQRLLDGARFIHDADVMAVPSDLDDRFRRAAAEIAGVRTALFVPLRKDGKLVGYISAQRHEVRPFSEKEIALLENFAAQAVIAMENARLLTEQREALEQQTATAEVLQVINASPGDVAPVFDAILAKAHAFCGAPLGSLVLRDGAQLRAVATRGYPREYEALAREGFSESHSPIGVLLSGQPFFHVLDVPARLAGANEDDPMHRAAVRIAGVRTALFVPLQKDATLIGYISAQRQEAVPFTDKQIALLQSFAAQAVIAMENARLLNEQREALEQQTATAEVLQVINASPGNLAPVFDAMLEKAMRLCGAAFGSLYTYDGERFHYGAQRGVPENYARFMVQSQLDFGPDTGPGRMLRGEPLVHIFDLTNTDNYRAGEPNRRALVDLGGARTLLIVPLRRDEEMLGFIMIYRTEVRPFTDKHVALLQNFADQAVIAMENARLLTEQREALEQQTATSEVLQVINASPGDLAPVFEAILEKAHRLCDATLGSIVTFDGEHFRAEATHGYPEQYAAWMRGGWRAHPQSAQQALIDGKPFVHVADLWAAGPWYDDEFQRSFIEATGVRTFLVVPLRKDGSLLGFIAAHRKEARAFTDKEITLLENFAAQAVIAMENARLLNEQREALEQQTATAEVLQVINASPGNLAPVFDAMLEKAMRLCEAAFGELGTYDGKHFEVVALRGVPTRYAEYARGERIYGPGTGPALILEGQRVVHVLDLKSTDVYANGEPARRAIVDIGGARTFLLVPLLKDEDVVGFITIYRQEVRPFTEKQILLLQSFAAQAVIAMDNAHLLNEIRQRQSELRVTFDNMGDGVAMFDADLRLAAWNRNFQQIIDLPDTLLIARPRYADYMRLLAERGEFGAAGIEQDLRQRIEDTDQELRLERVRPDGRVIEVRRNTVPGGGFVLIYSDITERKRSEEQIRAARDAAETALRELRTAQANLIQAEKMASLGQLTAGIAHEIKNPLNFVNNFAALSVDLLDELKETAAPGFAALTEKQRAEVEEVSVMLTSNLEKINEHGKRADGIVKAMLEHSRGSSGERRMVDLNALIDEALNLAYHGARAQDQSFNITLERDFGAGIAPIEVNPQDITRVFLNLFANGFYATTRRAREGGDAGFVPTLKVTTIDAGAAVEIRVRDNGTGIPADIRDKLFQPFFTTKPTGEGTGLGLSITYDIVTQQHGGSITVDSKVGEYSEFRMRLPRHP